MTRSPESLAARRTFAIVLAVGAFLFGGVCVGLIAVLAAGRAVDSAREQSQAAHAEAERRLEQALAAVETSSAEEAPPPDSSALERTTVEGWYSAALIAMAREGIARGWAQVRHDAPDESTYVRGLEQFRPSVERLPITIGRQLAEQRARDEIVEAGIEVAGVFQFLELLDAGKVGPFPDLVGDSERFGALFPCSIRGPVLEGQDLTYLANGPSQLEDGTSIRFGRGVSRVNVWMPRGSTPRCLTIEGAGMDATLLLAGYIGEGGARVEHLTLRDCTILSSSLFRFSGRGALVQVERVRVIGFDSGSGGSSCLDLKTTALLVRDSRFEGGYGRNPKGGGTLFDVRSSGLLARFERCRFDAMRLELEDIPDRATAEFSDCSMIDLRDDRDPRTVEHPGIRLVNCSVQMAVPSADRDWARDLNELFPDWNSAR